jgi:hypothetical protein
LNFGDSRNFQLLELSYRQSKRIWARHLVGGAKALQAWQLQRRSNWAYQNRAAPNTHASDDPLSGVKWAPFRSEPGRAFLGGFPAVLDERLLGDCGFVYSQMEYLLSFLELRRKNLDVHAFLPESGSYFASQPGALGNPKLKLFHLWHDSNRIYETRRLREISITLLG